MAYMTQTSWSGITIPTQGFDTQQTRENFFKSADVLVLELTYLDPVKPETKFVISVKNVECYQQLLKE